MEVIRNGGLELISESGECSPSSNLSVCCWTEDPEEGAPCECEVEFKSHTFNGGEESIKILNPEDVVEHDRATIIVRIMSSSDLMRLLLMTDALRQIKHEIIIELQMPYIPYARQDRVCDNGEAFSLKVFANIINSQNYKAVFVHDAHSGVAPALINNCCEIPVSWRVQLARPTSDLFNLPNLAVVSPDAGAVKRTYEFARDCRIKEVIKADKVRDVANGNILETTVYADDLTGKNLIIVDDICDGGRTFIELAKVLKTKNPASINLVVTHGIFSKGINVFDGLIDAIYATNSIRPLKPIPGKLHVVDIMYEMLEESTSGE